MAAASDGLNNRIQALPQELQDEILEYTLASDINDVCITPSYKPPVGLQINRKIRKKFADEYYKKSTFLVNFDYRSDSLASFNSTQALVCGWLASLSKEHWRKVACIHAYVDTKDRGFGGRWTTSEAQARFLAGRRANVISGGLHLCGVKLANGVLKVNYTFQSADGDLETRWTTS